MSRIYYITHHQQLDCHWEMMMALCCCYLILFLLGCFALGLNSLRISLKTGMNPKILTLLLPLLINFIAAHTVFLQINPLLTTLLPCLLCYFGFKKLENARIFAITSTNKENRNSLTRMIITKLHNTDVIECDRILIELLQTGQDGHIWFTKLLNNKKQQNINSLSQPLSAQKLLDLLTQNRELYIQFDKQMKMTLFWRVFKAAIVNLLNKKYLTVISLSTTEQYSYLWPICCPLLIVKAKQNTTPIHSQSHQKQSSAHRAKTEKPRSKPSSLQINLENWDSEDTLLHEFLNQIEPYMGKKNTKTK